MFSCLFARRHIGVFRFLFLLLTWLGAALCAAPVTFVFTSDVHYGINRGNFRGAVNVTAQDVNRALVATINRLPTEVLPQDQGLRAGQVIGPIDFVVVTGDISNRQELYPLPIQSATVSWQQFEEGFIRRLSLKNHTGQFAPLLLVPGNHDVSNAIGSPSKLLPTTDATTMAEIYNRMMLPEKPRTKGNFRYPDDRVLFARDFGGAHCIFLTMWPDRATRTWIAEDLRKLPATTPVLLFCHDQPDLEAKHLTNPNGRHDINPKDKFENVVPDIIAGGTTVDAPTIIEQRALATFLKSHPNIVGYFHGNANWNEFYTWTGPDDAIALNVFRADSPLKGKESGKHENRLSFQVVTYDVTTQSLTSRECLWNAEGRSATDATPAGWGATWTGSLAPRKK